MACPHPLNDHPHGMEIHPALLLILFLQWQIRDRRFHFEQLVLHYFLHMNWQVLP